LIATRRIVLLLPTGATALPALPLPALLRLICHLGLSFFLPGDIAESTRHRFQQPASQRVRAKPLAQLRGSESAGVGKITTSCPQTLAVSL
jgi:hypothetical protein